MDTIYRVNEIFTDEETFEVIAKCVDLIYDEEFEKYIGEPDDYLAKENASNLLKDSNFEIPEDVRADIEDIFGVAEFDKENDYESGYQFYDEFEDDIDDFDDEFDAYYDGYTEEDEDETSAYNRLKANASESFNLREALNRIDINTYNKYDLLNLYEACNLKEDEKRALANLVYDQNDPKVIYDTLNDKFIGGKEVEMPERVKDGVIHEDTDEPNTDVIKDMAVGEERSFSLNNYYKFENFTKFWVKKTDDDNFEIWMSSEDGKDIANHTKFSTLSNTLYWFGLTTVDGGGDIPTEVNEAFGDSQEGYDFEGLNRELRQELPADEIDHYNSDLYVKVTPKSKEILKKYGIHNHPLLSTFIDQITHTRWYDLPFAYVPINDTEVTEGYEFLDGTKVEAYSDYEIAEERAEELGLKMAEYGDYYNSDLSYCYWNKSGNRNDDAQVIVYYKFENGSPRPLTEMEREIVMDKYGIDSFDNPALEDDMGTYFDDVQPELEEDWTHFTYKSGANSYIATNDKEANKLVKKYGSKCKKVKDDSDGTSYYEIDDLNESSSKNDYTAEFTPRGSSGTQICKKDSVDNLIGELIKRGYSISGVLKERIIEWDKSGKKKFYGPCLTIIKGEAEMTDYTSF